MKAVQVGMNLDLDAGRLGLVSYGIGTLGNLAMVFWNDGTRNAKRINTAQSSWARNRTSDSRPGDGSGWISQHGAAFTYGSVFVFRRVRDSGVLTPSTTGNSI